MATKRHCDRCDAVIDGPPRETEVALSRSFFEDRGQTPDIAIARVVVTVIKHIGRGEYRPVDLCPACVRDAFDAAMIVIRQDEEEV